MTRYLRTMYRITDPEKSRAFYEAQSSPAKRAFDGLSCSNRLRPHPM